MLLMLMLMFSVFVACTACLSIPGRGIPHLWFSFRFLLFPYEVFSLFFLTQVEGLRIEDVTIVQTVKPSEANNDFGL